MSGREWPRRDREPGGYCVHGTYPTLICPQCEMDKITLAREEMFYEILDRLAAAIDKWAERPFGPK